MTQQPFNAAALRGAVDLSGLKRPAGAGQPGRAAQPAGGPSGSPTQGAGSAGAATTGLVVQGTDANFAAIVNQSMTVPAVVVLWSSQLPQSADFVDVVIAVAGQLEGRLQVVTVDVDSNPGLLRAFQVQSVPVTMGIVQGQPVPLFAGPQPEPQVRAYFDELLKLAVQHGVTGRVEGGAEAPADETPVEPALPPLHQAAYDAIDRGDLDAAATAYEQAVTENPADEDAKLGLAQVGLMRRTQGVDLAAARERAAAEPADVEAQLLVADLDLLGGHVEDAFTRLIDLVRATAGEDRDRVRTHLIELFAVVGNHDERVKRGRTALMSALF